MNKLYRAIFGVALAGLMLSPGAAYAASLTVTIKQVNSNSAAQTVSCTLQQKGCVLPFVLNAGQPTQQSVNINIAYFADSMVLNFQTPSGYFYTSAMVGNVVVYHALWSRLFQGSAPVTDNVTLFQPLAPRLFGAQPVSTSHTPAANLEITATPIP